MARKPFKLDHDSLVTMQDMAVDCVAVTRAGNHGGLIIVKLKDGNVVQLTQRLYEEAKSKFAQFIVKLKDGNVVQLTQRLYEEAKSKFAQFKRKYRISQSAARSAGLIASFALMVTMTLTSSAQSVTFKGEILGTDNRVRVGTVTDTDTVWADTYLYSKRYDHRFHISGIDGNRAYLVEFTSGGKKSTYAFDLKGIDRRRRLVATVDFSSPMYHVTWSSDAKSVVVTPITKPR